MYNKHEHDLPGNLGLCTILGVSNIKEKMKGIIKTEAKNLES